MRKGKRILFFYKNEDVKKREELSFSKKKSSLDIYIDIEFLPQEIKNLKCLKLYDLIVFQFNDFNTSEIIGIDPAYKYRRVNNDYSTPFCFIVNSKKYFSPDYLNPENIGEMVKNLLGNPQFGELNKAILFGETIFSNEDSGERVLKNFIEENPYTFPGKVCALLDYLSKSYNDPSIKNLKQKYYEVFVYFYDFKLKKNGNHKKIIEISLNDIDKIEENGEDRSVIEIKKVIKDIIVNKLEKKGINTNDILINDIFEVADSLDRFLNGLPLEKNPHRVKKELFRSPLPFTFQDLIDAKTELKKILNKGNERDTIKFLLIDNKIDDIKKILNKENEKRSIKRLLIVAKKWMKKILNKGNIKRSIKCLLIVAKKWIKKILNKGNIKRSMKDFFNVAKKWTKKILNKGNEKDTEKFQLINNKIDEIKKILNKGNEQSSIKLLLIDNRIDKVIRKNKEKVPFERGELWSVLFQPEYGCIFELSMLGKNLIITHENKDCEKEIFSEIIKKYHSEQDNNKLIDEYDKLEKEEKFDFVKFKKALAEYLNSDNHQADTNKKTNNHQADINEKNNYALNIYEKMKKAHFILLDFFLNKDNTYLAFNFISDICEIKKKKCDFSTVWYFITSAIYDAVIKYSESGLLDEYYEYAIVNAGDDPTNKKRQIIFMYKLIIFVLSRINSYRNYENFIENEFVENNHCKQDKIKKDKDSRDCLKEKQYILRKYITEYKEITKIFTQNQLKLDITELYDSIIKQYLYLAEADWYRIQMQIDLLNNQLNELNKNQKNKNNETFKFSCLCIIKELERRAKLY